jgi:hypothetical protein
MATSLSFHTLIFGEMISPSMIEIAKFGPKTQGILGVKACHFN